MPLDTVTDLYGYQKSGVAWLLRKDRALLADDMGLGKTSQALTAARILIRHGRINWALIVAPKTLTATWVDEATRWAPELCAMICTPGARHRDAAWLASTGRAHLVVTSYEQLREPPQWLVDHPPDLIIADEAHRLRRDEAQATQGVRSIGSRRKWALTGTPIERDEEDLAVLLSVLDPRKFSAADKRLHPSTLRARARPYVLRRTKAEVAGDLPPVVDRDERLALTEDQRKAYNEAIRCHAALGGDGHFLALFGELRSICDFDPRTGSSSKLDRVVDLLIEISDRDEKSIVFSYTLRPIVLLENRLKERNIGFVSVIGDTPLSTRLDRFERFRKSPEIPILLASTRVASEGLTLTEANNVLFVNRWWNPSANSQARDRVNRIGQKRNVFVHTFQCANTVEDRLQSILERKGAVFAELIDQLATGFSDDEKRELLRPIT